MRDSESLHGLPELGIFSVPSLCYCRNAGVHMKGSQPEAQYEMKQRCIEDKAVRTEPEAFLHRHLQHHGPEEAPASTHRGWAYPPPMPTRKIPACFCSLSVLMSDDGFVDCFVCITQSPDCKDFM